MSFFINLFLMIGSIFFSVYLTTMELYIRQKIIIWSLCFILFVLGIHREKSRHKFKTDKTKRGKFQKWLHKKEDLRGSSFIHTYINGLYQSPLLKNAYQAGEEYEKGLKFKKAIIEYKKCSSHPNATNENKMASNILVGNCYYYSNEVNEAVMYYIEALKISRRVKDKNEKFRARSVIFANLSVVYSDQYKFRMALKNNKKAQKIGNKTGDKQIISSMFGCMGIIYYKRSQYEKALKYHNDALDINRKIDHQKSIANDLCNIGVLYAEQGNTEKALKVLEESLDIYKRMDHKLGIVRTLDNIAAIYSNRGIPNEELKYRKEAFQIKKVIGNEKSISDAMGCMGSIYTKLCQFDQALKYHEDALIINRKIGYKQGIARTLGNIGLLYYELGQKDKSLICINNALKIFDEI